MKIVYEHPDYGTDMSDAETDVLRSSEGGPIDAFTPPRFLAALLTREPELVGLVRVEYAEKQPDMSPQIAYLHVTYVKERSPRMKANLAGLYQAYDLEA